MLSRYKLNEVFSEEIGRLVETTCCLFGCNHLRWRVTVICSFLFLWRAAFRRNSPQIKQILFHFFKLLIITLFHTTGGSDEGQDWELAKVGA